MNKKVGLVIGGIVLLFTGYILYLKLQANKLAAQLTYRLQSFQIKNFGLSNIRILSEIVVTNPTSVEFSITDYNIDVQVEGTTITTLKGGGAPVLVGANQSTTIPLDVQFDPRKVAQNLLSFFLDVFVVNPREAKGINIRYVGTISGKFGALGFSNIPVDYTYVP
jgi:LEA14-like dessication related protein